jgi:ABC-type phosphate/phosphonate transport system substrate-binding protein
VPSLPVEYFESILDYIEVRLGCEATLMYESRWECPPKDRRNPFEDNELDLAFMTRSAYIELMKRNVPVELLRVTSVHVHRRADDRPGRFVDIVVNRNIMESVKDFIDLRGVRWVRSVNDTMASLMTLNQLKAMGEGASFFGNILLSNNYTESMEMLLARKAHASAIDSNALAMYFKTHPDHKSELSVLTSWGPLPPYAIVLRKGLADEYKDRIADTLLNMNYDREGARILSEFNVHRFAATTVDDFKQEEELEESTRTMTFDPVYY